MYHVSNTEQMSIRLDCLNVSLCLNFHHIDSRKNHIFIALRAFHCASKILIACDILFQSDVFTLPPLQLERHDGNLRQSKVQCWRDSTYQEWARRNAATPPCQTASRHRAGQGGTAGQLARLFHIPSSYYRGSTVRSTYQPTVQQSTTNAIVFITAVDAVFPLFLHFIQYSAACSHAGTMYVIWNADGMAHEYAHDNTAIHGSDVSRKNEYFAVFAVSFAYYSVISDWLERVGKKAAMRCLVFCY